MKKSFMTRALATGLSLAMAFSLSAATNVTTAAAASLTKVDTKTLTEGKSTKVALTTSAANKYRIKSYKLTATAKQFLKAEVGTAGKAVTITAKKNAVTNAGATKKNLKITLNLAKKAEVSKKNAEIVKTAKVNVVVKAKPVEASAIVSATQTGVKQITVVTNFDATNSKVSLTKGTAAVDAKHTVSEDGKTITIATTTSLVAAQYTVKVDELSKDLQAEASKTDKIEFLSDKASVIKVGSVYSKAQVGYRVLNQFGDDITKSVSLTVSSSCGYTLKPSDHLIEFDASDATAGFMIGRDIITVSLLDTTSGVTATASLNVSAEAYASDITFEGVYNTDKKTLTEDTDFDVDDFYVLFSAKDQYGNKYNSYKGIAEGTDLYLTVIGGLTGLTKETPSTNFIVLNKDGVDYLAYKLDWSEGMTPTAGTASVQLLSRGGATCSGEITVAEGGRVVSLNVSQNGVIVAGEKAELSYTALDAAGKEVKSYKYLRDIKISGPTGTYPLAFERNTDGTAKLVLNVEGATVAKDDRLMLSYSFQTTNNKFSNVLVNVLENARPVAINGLRGVDTTLSTKTKYIDIKLKNLLIEDQYGRELNEYAVAGMTDSKKTAEYKLYKVTASVPKDSVLAVSRGGIEAVSQSAIFSSAVSKDTVLFQLDPQGKGTEVVTFKIENAASGTKALADVSVDVNFTVKNTSAVTSATASVDSVYALKADLSDGKGGYILNDTKARKYSQKVKVKANGALLSSDDYTVEAPYGIGVISDTEGGTDVWAVYCNVERNSVDKQFKDQTASTVTRTLTITLNGTGEKITTDVVIDTTAPKITTISDFTGEITVATNAAISKATLFGGAKPLVSASWIGDQYGKKVKSDSVNGRFTFEDGSYVDATYNFVCTVPLKGGVGAPNTLTNNNTTNATLIPGDNFAGATLTINFGGITKDVKVKI